MTRQLTWCVTLALLCLAASANSKPLRVRGGAELQAQARFVDGALELRGRLTDDAGAPLEGAFVAVQANDGPDLSTAAACPELAMRVARPRGGLHVVTAAGGELCLRFREAPERGSFVLRFKEDDFHGAARLEVDFDRRSQQQLSTRLRFSPRPHWLELDTGNIVLTVELALTSTTAHSDRGNLDVVLHGNDGAVLAQVRTSGDGKARFALPATKLAPPRAETLVASFAGNKTLSPSSDSQPVIVRSTAHVTLAEDVQAVARGEVGELLLELKPPHGVVQTGVVEATHQGRSVGSAPVTNGRARLRFDVDPGSAERFELTVQYLPSSPWWRPGAPLRVVVPVDPPSILTRVMLGLVVLLGIAGVIVSWHRSRKLPALNTRRRPLAAGVHVVTSRRGARGYSGTVVDAHDGRPLGGVTIIVRAPSLQDDGVLHRCETDRYGAFAFELDGRPEGTEMMAESGSHSAERKHLPGGGRFRIALMTRRRAVLRRFAAWVKRSGKPYEIEPEATPAHVRRTADNGDITDWASEVEVAAFSAAQVSKHVEHRLRDNEP